MFAARLFKYLARIGWWLCGFVAAIGHGMNKSKAVASVSQMTKVKVFLSILNSAFERRNGATKSSSGLDNLIIVVVILLLKP